MKKSEQKKLNETLDKALSPPPRRMTAQALDSLLDEYDEAQPKREDITAVPQYRSTAVIKTSSPTSPSIPAIGSQQSASPTAVPEYRSTAVRESSASPIPTKEFYRKSNQTADHVDRQLTPAESKVLDHLVRLSVGFNKDRCQVRISVLMDRTGYRSDKTVRTAILGLEIKGIIKRADHANSPAGDVYVIRPYSGNTAVPQYRSTAVENTPVLESNFTGQLNTELKDKSNDDDDAALAGLNAALKNATKEITGREVSPSEIDRWKEVADVLIAELKITAARTTISNVPAFLAEHLRRRLWKIDKKQAEAEGRELPDETVSDAQTVDTSKCPDCGGSSWWYPDGETKGVAKCKHTQLIEGQGSSS